ncbi:MAG TPA: sigma-70 family RNA polymerase sigma factor [Candidatus Cybelea sp.]|jgi:RNA polymerase sigma-70 factor (ECF subfamily)|nr:sigma-70 family RNA polymerase sigma factor [Candidatus Cybelea sp.]
MATGATDWLSDRFEENRPHLRSVAYRMLGSLDDADDAVQEAWLRLSRQDSGIENLGGWLTTVVGRICVDMLRSRRSKREEPLESNIPDFIVSARGGPEEEVMTADSVGLALLVVLDSLNPSERLAFVLHDMFAMPFEEIAPVVGRSPAAARQLASRARRRVQGATPANAGYAQRRSVVDAFLAAAREGDFEALVAVLDPNVLLLADREPASKGIRGAREVASQAVTFSTKVVARLEHVLVNGAPGVVSWLSNGRPLSIMGFVVAGKHIREMYVISQPQRVRQLLGLPRVVSP